jgi:hypothetical protein
LHGKKRTHIIAIPEAATNTDLPDVATSLPADADADDDANASTDSVKDTQSNTQSNTHPRATDHSIKLEPVVKTETTPAPANTSTDQADAPIMTEPVIKGPNLKRTVTVRRKAAKRTDPLYLAPPPQNIALP